MLQKQNKTSFALAIKHLKANNIIDSQEDIAKQLGYDPGLISSYKSGSKSISSNFIEKFESFYKIRLRDFEEGEKKYNRLSVKLNEVNEGVPIYDVPIDASFLERIHDSKFFEPMYFINIPKLRNCNFGAIVSGSSMYPIMKSGSIAMCRLVEDLNYFDPGEMYLLATTNGFETVKYVQQGEAPDELLLIPHNDKIKPTTIRKDMIIRMCIVEAWLNFR